VAKIIPAHDGKASGRVRVKRDIRRLLQRLGMPSLRLIAVAVPLDDAGNRGGRKELVLKIRR
jgi:hypothetical protein